MRIPKSSSAFCACGLEILSSFFLSSRSSGESTREECAFFPTGNLNVTCSPSVSKVDVSEGSSSFSGYPAVLSMKSWACWPAFAKALRVEDSALVEDVRTSFPLAGHSIYVFNDQAPLQPGQSLGLALAQASHAFWTCEFDVISWTEQRLFVCTELSCLRPN